MVVADRVREGVGNGFACAQPLHQRGSVVQDIGIGTVGVQGQAAVGSGFMYFGDEGHGVVQVRVLWLRQGSRCGDLGVFGDGCGCCGDCRGVVGPVNGYGQGIGGDAAVAVTDRIGKRVGGGFSGSEPLYERGRIVQNIGVGTVSVQGQAAVGSGFIHFGAKGHRVMEVRVLRLRQSS